MGAQPEHPSPEMLLLLWHIRDWSSEFPISHFPSSLATGKGSTEPLLLLDRLGEFCFFFCSWWEGKVARMKNPAPWWSKLHKYSCFQNIFPRLKLIQWVRSGPWVSNTWKRSHISHPNSWGAAVGMNQFPDSVMGWWRVNHSQQTSVKLSTPAKVKTSKKSLAAHCLLPWKNYYFRDHLLVWHTLQQILAWERKRTFLTLRFRL